MRTLVLGSGGRESALAWGLDRSPSVAEVVVAPGNPGVASFAATEDVDTVDVAAVVALTERLDADLVVVGPEAPLVAGVADELRARGRLVFGPGASAARIEGSKAYAKELMGRAGIPTAAARSFRDRDAAVAFIDELVPPFVVKADGLAAGKGVVVTDDRDDAVAAVDERLLRGSFGDAGRMVLIEEFLDGEEASLIALCDGEKAVPLEPAQDYKRVEDDDGGPNTGGMGSYSPVPACPPELARAIAAEVIAPMMKETARRGAPFIGALYAGLALTSAGPKVIEFNARFGDPETQALIPRIEGDLGSALLAAARGDLGGATVAFSDEACVSVVLASRGYPGPYETGIEIEGVDHANSREDVVVFHAGTASRDGRLVTAGGRVLAVSALGASFGDARRRAYDAAAEIRFEGMHMRTDIARRAEQATASRV